MLSNEQISDSAPSSGTSPLRIVTEIDENDHDLSWLSASSGSSSANSLFDAPPPATRTTGPSLSFAEHAIASRRPPPIPGLFAPPVLLPVDLADEVMHICSEKYFSSGSVNQVMLFGRALPLEHTADSEPGVQAPGLPPFLTRLLSSLCELLRPELPPAAHALLFPPPGAPLRSRQAILNRYTPGEGITPHVDLLRRFGDGIVGVSFGSTCTMGFRRVADDDEEEGGAVSESAEGESEWNLHLPERSIVVLSGDARYRWTHGIEGRAGDFVRDEQGSEARWIERGTRMSITFRWLLPGADIVGGDG